MKTGGGFRLSPEKAFLMLGLVFGLAFLILTPPFQAPDEWNHFFRAYQVSKGHPVSGMDSRGMAGERLPISLLKTSLSVFNNLPYTPENREKLDRLLLRGRLGDEDLDPFRKEKKQGRAGVILSLLDMPLESDRTLFLNFPGTALYPPVPYLPQAVGIALGRLLELPPVMLVYSGRLLNLLLWVLLTYLAIRITPFYKWLFLLLSLTPTPLFQAASLSADGVSNSSALLLVAVMLRFAFDTEKAPRTADMVLIFLLSLLLSLSKFYIFMPCLFLLVPRTRLGAKETYTIALLLFLCAASAAGAWAVITKGLHIQQRPGVFPAEQLEGIVRDPFNYLVIMLRTVMTQWTALLRDFTGKLGHFGPYMPTAAVYINVVVLAAAALVDGRMDVRIGPREKLIASAVIAASVLTVITPIYLTWTPLGEGSIQGVQGRYFFPLAPLILMLLYNRRYRLRLDAPPLNLPVLCYCLLMLTLTSYVLLKGYYL
jgi:uncharacterized membrane protein